MRNVSVHGPLIITKPERIPVKWHKSRGFETLEEGKGGTDSFLNKTIETEREKRLVNVFIMYLYIINRNIYKSLFKTFGLY